MTKMGLDDYIAMRLAAGVAREEAVAELENAALIEALAKPPRPEPPTGTDGDETCRKCAEQLREHKLADQLRRNKAFPAGEVEVARYYCRQAAVAISQGKMRGSVWGEETERITGQSPATATRLHKAYEAFQADPEIGPTLPFRIERETRSGKDHLSIVVTTVPDDPAERTTAGMLAKLTHLRRPDGRGSHGGPRDACPKCSSPMTRTTYDVCQNEACGHMVTHPSRTVGRAPFHDETESSPVQIGGDLYAVEVQAPRPFHDEMKRERTYSKQDETVPDALRPRPLHDETVSRRPISFVSRDDQQWADTPNYWGEAPPDDPPVAPAWQPPPMAPSRHLPYWSRPGWREQVRDSGRAGRDPFSAHLEERNEDVRR
jgi:hypothetical protein